MAVAQHPGVVAVGALPKLHVDPAKPFFVRSQHSLPGSVPRGREAVISLQRIQRRPSSNSSRPAGPHRDCPPRESRASSARSLPRPGSRRTHDSGRASADCPSCLCAAPGGRGRPGPARFPIAVAEEPTRRRSYSPGGCASLSPTLCENWTALSALGVVMVGPGRRPRAVVDPLADVPCGSRLRTPAERSAHCRPMDCLRRWRRWLLRLHLICNVSRRQDLDTRVA